MGGLGGVDGAGDEAVVEGFDVVDGDGFVTPDGGEGVAAIAFDFLTEEAEFEFAAAFEGGGGFVEDGEVAFEFVIRKFSATEL